MRVKQIMDDADQRRVGPLPARTKTADRAVRRHQALPSKDIKLRRQRRLVKIEVAAPQLAPALAVGGAQFGDDDLCHGYPSLGACLHAPSCRIQNGRASAERGEVAM